MSAAAQTPASAEHVSPAFLYLYEVVCVFRCCKKGSACLNLLRGAQREGLDGERRRLAATGRGKDAGVGNPEIAPAVAAAEGIDNRAAGIVAHPAGAEHMRCGKPVPARVALV